MLKKLWKRGQFVFQIVFLFCEAALDCNATESSRLLPLWAEIGGKMWL